MPLLSEGDRFTADYFQVVVVAALIIIELKIKLKK